MVLNGINFSKEVKSPIIVSGTKFNSINMNMPTKHGSA